MADTDGCAGALPSRSSAHEGLLAPQAEAVSSTAGPQSDDRPQRGRYQSCKVL